MSAGVSARRARYLSRDCRGVVKLQDRRRFDWGWGE